MYKLRTLLITGLLTIALAAPAFAWTTNSYSSESSFVQTVPVDREVHRGYYRERDWDRDFDRPYYRDYGYTYYDPYYYGPYYYSPGVRLDLPFFSFGF